VATRYSSYFRPRRILRGPFAVEFLSNVAVAKPDVHLTTSCQSKEPLVLIGPLLHGIPWRIGIDIDPTDIGNRARRSGYESEALGWFVLEEEIAQKAEESRA